MRTAEEILELVLETAQKDERIRAVLMNGSRVNPNAPSDPFQDFDFIYIVTEADSFRKAYEWVRRFGKIMIMQVPEEMHDPAPDDDGGYGYLMQFTDGSRIDLGICPLEKLDEALQDSLTVCLLDKDGILPELPPPDDRDYLPKPPTAKAFADCCNEFWWVCPYVAKGLWRQEILFARAMLDQEVRTQLMKMLTWYIGMQTAFSVNPGKRGKYFQHYLEPELWDRLLQTYAEAGYENTWAALFNLTGLFGEIAVLVAERFGFDYPFEDEQKVGAHLKYVHSLPADAQELYPEL
jgi:aminoglycoside 6-adenylyltransferase